MNQNDIDMFPLREMLVSKKWFRDVVNFLIHHHHKKKLDCICRGKDLSAKELLCRIGVNPQDEFIKKNSELK